MPVFIRKADTIALLYFIPLFVQIAGGNIKNAIVKPLAPKRI